MQHISALSEITDGRLALFCDVWGVVHNGVVPFPDACAALHAARRRGLAIILVTNSPRPAAGVIDQLDGIGVPRDAWDAIVTSGDVTRALIAAAPRRILHVGPPRELALYDGLDVTLTDEAGAEAVCCTGLYDDEAETPEDYAELLARLAARRLPFICANPDIVVERGTRMIWCAGALARDYAALGGSVTIAGKPHAPIYEAAMRLAGERLGRPATRSGILAIGDGMPTDIRGAAGFGLDALFISGGIHAHEHGGDRARLEAFVAASGFAPVAAMDRLA